MHQVLAISTCQLTGTSGTFINLPMLYYLQLFSCFRISIFYIVKLLYKYIWFKILQFFFNHSYLHSCDLSKPDIEDNSQLKDTILTDKAVNEKLPIYSVSILPINVKFMLVEWFPTKFTKYGNIYTNHEV